MSDKDNQTDKQPDTGSRGTQTRCAVQALVGTELITVEKVNTTMMPGPVLALLAIHNRQPGAAGRVRDGDSD